MEETLREIEQLLNKQIAKCEEIKGLWNGDESGHLEDQAGLYTDIQDRLEDTKKYLLEAIILLHDE